MGGHGIELGLEAGPYVVTMDGAGNTVFEANVTLALGQRAELARLAFHPGGPLERVARARRRARARVRHHGHGRRARASPLSARRARRCARFPVHLGLVPMPGDARGRRPRRCRSASSPTASAACRRACSSRWARTSPTQFMDGTQITIGANLLRGPGRGGAARGRRQPRDRVVPRRAAGVGRQRRARRLPRRAARGRRQLGRRAAHGAQLAAGVNVRPRRRPRRAARGRRQPDAGQLERRCKWPAASTWPTRISGAQLAPLNIAGTVEGAQIGVVNVAGDETGAPARRRQRRPTAAADSSWAW